MRIHRDDQGACFHPSALAVFIDRPAWTTVPRRVAASFNMVKCIGIDEKSGKIKLSRKALIPKPEGADSEPEGEAPARDDRPRRPRPPRRS